MQHFKLVDDEIVECELDEWGEMFKDNSRVIRRSYIQTDWAEYMISTVFIGLDHQLFETMAFHLSGEEHPLKEVAFRSWSMKEACAMHRGLIDDVTGHFCTVKEDYTNHRINMVLGIECRIEPVIAE